MLDFQKGVHAMDNLSIRAIVSSIALLVCLLAEPMWQGAYGEDVTLGISSVGLYEVPAEIAKRKGFYKEEGLNVQKVIVRTGLQATALSVGELDYSSVGGAAIRAAAKGLAVRSIMGWFDRPLHVLVGRPGIKGIKDLKNKKVAISSIGSTPYLMMREALSANGMDPDHDVVFLSIGGSSARIAALQAGTVDASPLDVAYIEKTDKLGLPYILYFGDVVDLPLGGLATSVKKIKTNPDQIKRMIRATLKGIRFFKSNRGETLEIIKDYLKISPEYVGKVYDFAVRSLNEDGIIGKTSLANELRFDQENAGLKERISEEKVIDWSFVRAVNS
jgi:NitT/TauT family transport system substrate-binding protein